MDPKEHLALAKVIPGEDKRGGKRVVNRIGFLHQIFHCVKRTTRTSQHPSIEDDFNIFIFFVVLSLFIQGC